MIEQEMAQLLRGETQATDNILRPSLERTRALDPKDEKPLFAIAILD